MIGISNGKVRLTGANSKGEWAQIINDITDGGIHVSGLARKAVLQGEGSYKLTDILGYEVISQGSDDWSVVFGSDPAIALPAASRVAGAIYPQHLTSITLPAGASELLYIPINK